VNHRDRNSNSGFLNSGMNPLMMLLYFTVLVKVREVLYDELY